MRVAGHARNAAQIQHVHETARLRGPHQEAAMKFLTTSGLALVLAFIGLGWFFVGA